MLTIHDVYVTGTPINIKSEEYCGIFVTSIDKVSNDDLIEYKLKAENFTFNNFIELLKECYMFYEEYLFESPDVILDYFIKEIKNKP